MTFMELHPFFRRPDCPILQLCNLNARYNYVKHRTRERYVRKYNFMVHAHTHTHICTLIHAHARTHICLCAYALIFILWKARLYVEWVFRKTLKRKSLTIRLILVIVSWTFQQTCPPLLENYWCLFKYKHIRYA